MKVITERSLILESLERLKPYARAHPLVLEAMKKLDLETCSKEDVIAATSIGIVRGNGFRWLLSLTCDECGKEDVPALVEFLEKNRDQCEENDCVICRACLVRALAAVPA